MSGILTPGYLRWDGTKYVLDHDVEIVGPPGSAGPAGPVGPAGPPGPSGVASGDLAGIYPGPISVVGLTGILGVVNFGGSILNPTISQTLTGGVTGQTLTFRAQNAATFGGNVVLQSGTGTTAGLVQFLVGSNTAAYFDPNSTFRYGPNSTSTSNGPNGVSPIAGTDFIYGNSASGNIFDEVFCGSSTQKSLMGVYNTAAGGTGVSGVSLQAPGTGNAVVAYQGQGVIEQSGASTSALVFGKVLGNGTSRAVTGRIWQSGAWAVGDSFLNDSSTDAQAGVVGAVINVSPSNFGANGGTVTPTSTTRQAIIFNQWNTLTNDHGILALQGHFGVNLMSQTTSVASTTTTKFITSVGRRVKVLTTTATTINVTASDEIISIGTLAGTCTVNLPASPTIGDTYTIKDANGSAGSFNITINGNGTNIDGGLASIVVMTNFTQATFVYNGTTWISSLTNNISPNSGYTSVVNVASGGSTTVTGFDQLIVCDPSSVTCTVTAPLTPLPNMRFTVKDATFTADGVHFIAVNGNGKTLENPASIGTYASPINLTTAGRSATWAYDPTRLRWTLVSTVP